MVFMKLSLMDMSSRIFLNGLENQLRTCFFSMHIKLGGLMESLTCAELLTF